jgi:hypothetical protein
MSDIVRDRRIRGAGYFLPGVWRCLLAIKAPKIGGYRELIKTISATSDRLQTE